MSAVDKLIEAAGGPKELADVLTGCPGSVVVSRDDVYNWRRRRRFPAYLVPVARKAAEKLGRPDALEDFDRESVQYGRRRVSEAA